jgi:hypothetical protein
MLDETIASTRKRKDRLLKVLIYPELPLHNNGSEIALREGVIRGRSATEREVKPAKPLGRIN